MRTTGIIRRIDELGRLVIPKEMRKRFHLMEGDSVEFVINEQQDIVIRKYSLLQPWEHISQLVLITLAKQTQNPVFMMNNEYFIQCSRDLYKEFLNKALHGDFLKNTIVYTNQQFSHVRMFQKDSQQTSGYVFPIVVHGDWIASFVILEMREPIGEIEIKVMEAFRCYFVNTMEG